VKASGPVSFGPEQEKAIGDISEHTERGLRYRSCCLVSALRQQAFRPAGPVCVIFLSAAIPSFEVDASLEELKSINHRLINIQTGIEKLQAH